VRVESEERRGEFRGRIDEDAALAYALATNDRNPLYLDGTAVPPLFTATLILHAMGSATRVANPLASVTGARGGVHGEHDVFFWGVVHPGMAVEWDSSLYGMRQTRGGVLMTRRILVSDTNGAPLVEHFWSDFLIGGTIEGDFVESNLVDHTFPEEARRRPYDSRTLTVDRDQAFRYAGVSGDFAGHAIDESIALEEGYPGKILQGLCTFGMCSGAVVDMAAQGDPRRLRRLAGRFAAPAFPGLDMVVDAYDVGVTEEGGRAFVFEAVQDGVTVVKHGRVELIPD